MPSSDTPRYLFGGRARRDVDIRRSEETDVAPSHDANQSVYCARWASLFVWSVRFRSCSPLNRHVDSEAVPNRLQRALRRAKTGEMTTLFPSFRSGNSSAKILKFLSGSRLSRSFLFPPKADPIRLYIAA